MKTISDTFASIQPRPGDPILGVTEAFLRDPNPNKVNLGVGIYQDGNGKVPVLEVVAEVEKRLAAGSAPKSYLPIDGLATFNNAIQSLLLGTRTEAADRMITVQAPGGTGGLRIGAEFLRRFFPDSEVWISNPSWENHQALFEMIGAKVNLYPYYDAEIKGINRPAMFEAFSKAKPGTVVLLHACCHNPTGFDLNATDWARVLEIVHERELIPFIDFAYHGFNQGLEEDAAPLRSFINSGWPCLIAYSLSKSFAMYQERVGAFSIVCPKADDRSRVLSQLKAMIRVNYSNPPAHGAKIVSEVLSSTELRARWESELSGMRERLKRMRKLFVDKMTTLQIPGFEFVTQQNGMFSYSGLSATVVERLALEHSIYLIRSGRLCVAALNEQNIERVCAAIAKCVISNAAAN